MNSLLVMSARELEGRDASPTAGIIDSQSVKTTESGVVRGFDAGKKVKGRKRHILTDTLGLLLLVIVHAADVQDRAPDLFKAARNRFPWMRHVFADGGYAGDKLLIKAGKPAKIAITAAMRKLITTANALIRDDREWTEKSN